LGITSASANKITYEQAVGACKGSKDGNGDIACSKCGTINDRTCTHTVVYQCEGKNCTTRVDRVAPSGNPKNTGFGPKSSGILDSSAGPSAPGPAGAGTPLPARTTGAGQIK
jgi:hypothetical protein